MGQKLLSTPRSSKAPPPAARVVEVSTESRSQSQQQQGLNRYASQPEETVATPMAAKTRDPLESSHEERVLVVGRGVVLTANVTSCDKVIVEGQFQGNIKTGTFILTEGKYLLSKCRGSRGFHFFFMKKKGEYLFVAYVRVRTAAAAAAGDLLYCGGWHFYTAVHVHACSCCMIYILVRQI